MTKLNTSPVKFWQLVKLSFTGYPVIVKSLWPLFIFAAVIHLINPAVFRVNVFVGWTVLVGFLLLTWYLFAVILYGANNLLTDKKFSFAESFRYARKCYLFVIGGNLIFLAICAVLVLIEYALTKAAFYVHLDIPVVIISVIFDIFIFVAIYFALPLIVLNRRSVLASFIDSLQLVWGNWWRTFLVMLVVIIIIMLGGAVGVMLTSEHRMLLLTVFNFFYQLIFYPLIISTTLVLLNDLQLRKK